MSLEVERKYLNADLAAARARLGKLGAKSEGRHFEENVVFDTADGLLFRQNKLLRLRSKIWKNRTESILTCKWPLPGADPSLKIREELETAIGNRSGMADILLSLGYRIIARYEKTRETFWLKLDESAPIKVELDLLPFCQVIEIEGDAAGINRAAALLGLDKLEISTKSYNVLHQEWRASQGLPPDLNILFDADKKLALLSACTQAL